MSLYILSQQGDREALGKLVQQHLPLVRSLSRRFSFSEDAYQMGCMGLVQAIRRYRENCGCAFSTFAVPWILGEMRRAYTHHLGWRSRTALKKARKYRDMMLQTAGQEPTVRDMANHAGINPEELMLLLERDQPEIYDETGCVLASVPDPNGDAWLVHLLICDILLRMQPEECWLIRQRFSLGRTQTEIARSLGLNPSSISRKEKAARQHFLAAWNE